MTVPRVATYRLQFRNGMTFERAVGIVPYLKRLGVSHLYASPIFTAASGSTHGYDVTDHNEIDPAIGGQAGFERLAEALKRSGMGLLLDIVPNHMAASLENRWWRSVVELGTDSPYLHHFDIDWSRKLTLPVLGRDYREVLAAGELVLKVDPLHGCLALAYFEHLIPLHPATYPMISSRLSGDDAAQVASIARARSMRPGGSDEVRTPMSSNAEGLSSALAALSADRAFLDAVHADQPWQLLFWQEARHRVSYRRFFEVTGLIGVKVEDEVVFDDVHRQALALLHGGLVDGLRVDHVDGLAAPTAYLRRLREKAGPGAWLVGEKILGEGERLPDAWRRLRIGTTGYEFTSAMADLLVGAEGAARMRDGYRKFGDAQDDAAALRQAKLLILKRNFEGELATLTHMAVGLAEVRDAGFAREGIEDALVELIAAFAVYRTYCEDRSLSRQDRAVLDRAVDQARRAGADGAALRFIADLIGSGEQGSEQFRTRFQQLTGPVMAKAVEDTFFYRSNALIALNEVGAPPLIGTFDVGRFHDFMIERVGDRDSLLATATHDTKRGEDARARLYVLAQDPDGWLRAAQRWRDINAGLRDAGVSAPEPSVEWMLYQALAGVWPPEGQPDPAALSALRDRFLAYAEKALREAKLGTDWLAVDEDYESAVLGFVRRVLDKDNLAFLDDFHRTLQPIIHAGAINSLSQMLAKLTAAGVPDIYQGSERADFSLVDPDNRRPVDFRALERGLRPPDDLASLPALLSGDLKQRLAAKVLAVRRERLSLFMEGRHTPLEIRGPGSEHFAAYLREHEGEAALVVLQRASQQQSQASGAQLAEVVVPASYQGVGFRNVITGSTFQASGSAPLRVLLDGLQVALCITPSDG